MSGVPSSLARWLPLMRADQPPPPLSRTERQQLAKLMDRLGYVCLPKEDLRNVELDAVLVVQRRYLELRV